MKTISINLAGNTVKTSLKAKKQASTEIDSKTKLAAITMVISAVTIFLISFVLWMVMMYSTKKVNSNLNGLKSQHQVLKAELAELTDYNKSLQKEKKIFDIKMLASEEVYKSLLPWQNILTTIAKAVPKDIKINKISKKQSTRNSEKSQFVLIEGQITARSDVEKNPLKLISFFVLNINENKPQNSILSNAEIKDVNYKSENDIYEFKIEVKINKPENKTVKKQEE